MRRVLRALLVSRGYVIYEAATGEEVLNLVPRLRPDVVLLDLGLPDMDGVDVIRRLRQLIPIPIIVLSVRAGESDKIAALDAGADDYLTKPYQSVELLEHIRAAIFRHNLGDNQILMTRDLVVDLQRRTVQLGGKEVELTLHEYDLLSTLAVNADRILTQRRLSRQIWGDRTDKEAIHMLRTTINNLRSKLEVDPARPRYIATEPGVGYRLRVEP